MVSKKENDGINRKYLLSTQYVPSILCIFATKIEFVERDMMVQRKTASKYLDMIVDTGLLQKMKMGTSNYYVNIRLMELLANVNVPENAKTGT